MALTCAWRLAVAAPLLAAAAPLKAPALPSPPAPPCPKGGFRGAAKSALGSDEVSAEVRAISATAAHRLQRGIWTSPGAGDLRRCVAACERLVMLLPDAWRER
jgi:hypothetical protein